MFYFDTAFVLISLIPSIVTGNLDLEILELAKLVMNLYSGEHEI